MWPCGCSFFSFFGALGGLGRGWGPRSLRLLFGGENYVPVTCALGMAWRLLSVMVFCVEGWDGGFGRV